MTGTALVRLATAALWLVVASGPALGALALARAGATAERAPGGGPGAGVTAFAEAAVVAHLTAPLDVPARLRPVQPITRTSAGTARRTAAAPAEATAPTLLAGPRHAAAVAVEAAGPGRWGVRVLVVDRAGSVETWQATVVEGPGGPVLDTAPVLVPTTAAAAASSIGVGPLRPPEDDDPLAASVEGFLRALLLAEGDLTRYVPTTSDLGAGHVPALADLTLSGVGAVRVGSTTVAVLADVDVRRPDGRHHRMHMPLLLGNRHGRWEVLRILPALPLAGPEAHDPTDDTPRSTP